VIEQRIQCAITNAPNSAMQPRSGVS